MLDHVSAILLRKGFGIFALVTCQFAFQPALIVAQFLVRQHDQDLSLRDRVARARKDFLDEAVDRRGDAALYQAFEFRRCGDVLFDGHQQGKRQQRQHGGGHDLGLVMAARGELVAEGTDIALQA